MLVRLQRVSLGFEEIGALHSQNKVKKSKNSAENRIFNG